MTPLGLFVIPITLIAALMGPRFLIPILIVTAVLEGGAVIVLESFGLPPYYFVACLVTIRLVPLILSRKIGIPWQGWLIAHSAFLITFAVIATASAFLLPQLFEGTLVYAPRAGIGKQDNSLAPLGFSISNLGQSIYLWLNVCVVVYTALTAGRTNILRYIQSFLWSGVLVVSIGLYQIFAELLDLPFPYGFLLNNPFRSLLFDITFHGLPRINATFPEASIFAVFTVTFLAFIAIQFLLAKGPTATQVILIMLTIEVLLLSTSSTAYVGIIGLLLAITVGFILVPAIQRGAFERRAALSLGAALGLILLTLFSLPPVRQVVVGATLDKPSNGSYENRAQADLYTSGQGSDSTASSSSYENRMQADLYALTLLSRTNGLGVGLGSNRPSSFAAWLLSNTGLLGSTLFLGAVLTLIVAVHRSPLPMAWRYSVLWAFITVLLVKTVSSPDLSTPVLWVLWGLCLAIASQPRSAV